MPSYLHIGKTTPELSRRISQHLSTINTKKDVSLSRHINTIHGGNCATLKFWGLRKVTLGPRQGDLNERLLREEAKFIYLFDSMNPRGLNEGFTFTAFL